MLATNSPAHPESKLRDDGRLLLFDDNDDGAVLADNDDEAPVVVASPENAVVESGIIMASAGVDSVGMDS